MISDILKSKIPMKTIEVEDLPDAFLLSDLAYEAFVSELPPSEQAKVADPGYCLQFNCVRVLRKSRVVVVE